MISIASPSIGNEEISAVTEVLKSKHLAQGKYVDSFEKEFSKYVGVNHSVMTSNGTTALFTALNSLGLKPDDEVITTPFSFIASANSILYAGAKPVFADINPDTYNLNPESIKEKITPRTKAVLCVDLFGQTCDMDAIQQICADKNLLLIEDASQAHGAEYKSKKAGSFGDVACFSFYATKNITCGEGGAITTNDAALAEKCRKLINHGQASKYNHDSLGYNFRLTDMQAAIGCEQLKKLDSLNAKRISNAAVLSYGIKHFKTPTAIPGYKHVFHQYVIECSQRDKLQNYLLSEGIQTAVHYPSTIPAQPFYKKMGYAQKCPVAEEKAKQVLSIPVHPSLTKEEINFVTEKLNTFS
jgi:perosamine synthetase